MVISHNFIDEDYHDEANELLLSGETLSLDKILEIIRKQIRGRILEVELEHQDDVLVYELEILDKQGIVWKIKVNATTGTIIEKEQD